MTNEPTIKTGYEPNLINTSYNPVKDGWEREIWAEYASKYATRWIQTKPNVSREEADRMINYTVPETTLFR